MTDAMWAAAGIRMPERSVKEQEHLAVLRVTALATDPAEPRLLVRWVDLLGVLAVLDRVNAGPAVESVMVVDKPPAGTCFAVPARVYQSHWRFGSAPAGSLVGGRVRPARPVGVGIAGE